MCRNQGNIMHVSSTRDTFGTLLWITDVPSSGNDPHHLGPSLDGKTLVGGGLLSLLKTQDTAFYFDTTNPYRPTFKKSNRALLSSIADEIRAKPDGGFYITYMGSAVGTSPGRLVETDADFNIIHEWPQDVESTLNILGEQFNPHGLSIDWERKNILTSDFVEPRSLSIRSLMNVQGGGIQDVKHIPGNPEGAALATAVHLGQVWIIYPERKDAHGKPGVAELLFDLGPKARDTVAIYAWTTPTKEQPTIGPHYVKVTPDQKHLVVTDYFVQTGNLGLINTPADFKALYVDILDDGSLSFNRSIDFQREFANRGGAKPHSSVIFDLTDPENPLYY
ncbi:conserved hypothetical protein [Chaetomium globosum CBS 148.51]|uniref:Methanethiol oxidase n=1 Tax=Chaetomium globosum (strain ATCC 6205 / CBS 148.51 / DSM 1962 / NBRC 6347 / NRRL 1970) TaxID=306901 RepID=Q2GSJ6_CHAGB|nr:uncharacterized protein CHGG_09058 [Chaetomium globosum CBS 148.51]EAQ85044.1 conserved hypothetical protein [Chaetomium globosum CBS 148.51]